MSAAKLQKGIRAAQKGEMKRAASLFEAVLKADPGNIDALALSGAVAHKLGNSDKAIRRLMRAASLDPENAGTHNNLGNVYKESGRDAEAVASYERALTEDPLNVACLNNYAVVQRNAGAFEASVNTLEHAITLAPDMAELHQNLGRTLVSMERLDEAIAAFREAMELAGEWADPLYVAKVLNGRGATAEAKAILTEHLTQRPDDETARYYLSALSGEDVERAPDTYVTSVFNSFAASFDSTLENLDYRAPALVAEALAEQKGPPDGSLDILDIGCGTGLCGPLVTPFKNRMVGIDLSPEMLKRAELRGCYDALRVAELQAFLEASAPESVDVALCVDTLVYLGALDQTFAGVARVLREDGLFIGTAEAMVDEHPSHYAVDRTGRFKHSQSYITATAEAAGLTGISIKPVVLRREVSADVTGYLMVLART